MADGANGIAIEPSKQSSLTPFLPSILARKPNPHLYFDKTSVLPVSPSIHAITTSYYYTVL
jgi:hypothetical protein